MASTSLTLKLKADVAAFIKNMKAASGSFGKFSKGITKNAKKMQNFGSQLSIAVTAPIIAMGGFSLSSAIKFESAFAGVRKTIEATEPQFKDLEKAIRKMATELPASAVEIAGVAEAAGQLGIAQEDILSFTRTMIDLGTTTDLSAREAATALAQFTAITGLSTDEVSGLASALVALGNNSATTERKILDFGLRMAAAANIVGFAEEDTLALAAGMSSVGIQAEAGGSAMTKVMIKLASAIKTPGEELDRFAQIAGVSAKEFQRAFEEDAALALVSFIEGLDGISKSGGNVFAVLDDLGLAEVRVRNALLSAAGAGDQLRESIELGRKAKIEDIALTEEAAKRNETAASKLKIMRNRFNDLNIALGNELVPQLIKFMDSAINPLIIKLKEWATAFGELTPKTKALWIGIGSVVAILGPFLVILGKVILLFLGPAGWIVALVATHVWLRQTDGILGDFTRSLEANAEALIETIKRTGFWKTALAGVLTGMTGGFVDYETFIKLLGGVTKAAEEQADALVKGAEDATTASKDMFFALGEERKKHDKEVIKSAVNITRIITKEERKRLGDIQEAMGKKIQLEASLDRERERFARIHGKRQEFMARIILRIAQDLWMKKEALLKKEEAKAAELFKKQGESFGDMTDVIRAAGEGVTASIKLLWTDTTATIGDAFRSAGDTFAGIMGQMVAEAGKAAKLTGIQMAGMMGGISLVVGLIASVFGGKGKGSTGPSKIATATKTFLDSIRDALKGFESEVLTTLEKITKSSIQGKEALEKVGKGLEFIGRLEALTLDFPGQGRERTNLQNEIRETFDVFVDTFRTFELFPGIDKLKIRIIELSTTIRDAVLEEFKLKKETINEVINLLKREKDFVRDINQSIISVTRAFFAPDELFKVQKEDIEGLKLALAGALEEDRLPILADLKSALLASFESAKDIFKDDPVSLKTWQSEVIKGLEFVRESGKSHFQILIDDQFKILKLTEKQTDIQGQMNTHLINLENAMFALLGGGPNPDPNGGILKQIGDVSGDVSQSLFDQLTKEVGVLGIGLAHGGIVTKPTLAMIAEGGQPEAVIPLDRLGAIGGKVTQIFNISLHVKDIGSLTVGQVENLLKTKFARAAERLNRQGFRSPLQPKPI